MIYAMAPDNVSPTGGVRKLYRLVDLLNASNRPATLLHQNQGFRCTWFQHQTPIAFAINTPIRPDDLLIVPEIFCHHLANIAPGVPKVIFNQNANYTFIDWPLDRDPAQSAYRHPDVRAVVVVSEDSAAYLHFAFPGIGIYRVHYGIDPVVYAHEPAKQPLVAFMPRKQAGDALQVIHLLQTRRALDGFHLLAIENCSEAEVATRLRATQVFRKRPVKTQFRR
jgi:hypothetical protein